MKTALKIGFNKTTQHWKAALVESRSLIAKIILVTLLESFFLHECVLLLAFDVNNYYSFKSIVDVDILDFSDNENSVIIYLLGMTRSFFYELTILNSFFLGVYWHHTGLPKTGTRNSTPSMDNVLDVPIEHKQGRLTEVLQYIEKSVRIRYFQMVVLLIVIQIIGNLIGNFLYDVLILVGYTYYWILGMVPYLLLLLLYLKWLGLSFEQFWQANGKWIGIVVGAIVLPSIGRYVGRIIRTVLVVIIAVFAEVVNINALLGFISILLYSFLWLTLIGIFYSQTLIYFKNEQEA